MAKDRKKLLHIHSSIPDKQPTPQSLEVGEIAVNNAAGKEFISFKNTENKVKRFSSDEQMIDWMEKKAVIPYEAYVRGSDGPSGSTGTNSVTNDDLLQNKSNIIVKINQVAAKNTPYYNKINGAKDIYNKDVNPSQDGGLHDGAGFAIDMSRYAMIGANPSFSSVTTTDRAELSGNVIIKDGDGTGTRTGNTLTIDVTNVNETVVNRNATIGNDVIHISGTTTEYRDGTAVENNLEDYFVNTTGNVYFTTSGNTVIHSDNAVGITSLNDKIAISTENDIFITANDDISETCGHVAAFMGMNTTNIGSDIDGKDTGTSVNTNIYGENVNISGGTVNLSGDVKIKDLIIQDSLYKVSDSNEVEYINDVDHSIMENANALKIKRIIFSTNEENIVYAAIAQDAENLHLNDIIKEDSNGIKSIDYNSLNLLKIAYLEEEVRNLRTMIEELKQDKQ